MAASLVWVRKRLMSRVPQNRTWLGDLFVLVLCLEVIPTTLCIIIFVLAVGRPVV